MARRVEQPADDDDVNMTPLLDIVFIMLIFFIVTSTFVKEPGEEVIRPYAETSQDLTPAILVAINDRNEIWINKEEVELDAVRVTVQRMRAENPKGGAAIQVDEESETSYLVEVMDQLNLAGVPSVAIVTKED